MRWSTILITICVVCFGFNSRAQEGQPFMTELAVNRQFSDSKIGSIVQESGEAMFFATAHGLLKYDGSNWERISTSSPVQRVFHHENSDRIFLGLKKGAVEVLLSDSGAHVIKAVDGLNSNQPINHIIGTEKDVYFIGESEIHLLSPLEGKAATVHQFSEKLISGAFVYLGDLYILFFQEGLFNWDESAGLQSVGNFKTMGDDQMLFTFESLQGTYIGFDSDALYLFSAGKFNKVADQLSEFLSDNILSDGLLLNDSLLAFSTLAGGAVVVNAGSYDVKYRFDYSTGVKDNEIFCLGKDRDHGLWLAYETGITRVDLLQPVKNFGIYPGLEGNLTSSIMVDNTLHVGTGNGVFILKQATSKAELDQMMDEIIRKQRAAKEQTLSSYIPPAPKVVAKESDAASMLDRFEENPEEVKNELSRKEIKELKKELRQRRKEERKNKSVAEVFEDIFAGGNKDENDADAETTELPKTPSNSGLIPNPTVGPAGSGMTAPPGSGGAARSKPQVLSNQSSKKDISASEQKVKKLQNSFLYKKVKGIDVKCRQLVNVKDQVFAATNNGLYLIREGEATNLTPGLYINHVAATDDKNRLLLATLTGVHELAKNNIGKWISRPLNDSVQYVAYNVTEGSDGNIWSGADNGAYQYTSTGVRFHHIPNTTNERVLVSNVYGKMHFLLASGLYHYLVESDTILATTLPDVPNSDRLEYMLGNDNMIWIRSASGWNVLNGENFTPMLPYLDLFEDIRHLSTDDNGNIYVIEHGQKLFSIQHRNEGEAKRFNIYIRQVVDANGQTFSLQKMKIETDGNELTFNVSAPFYLKSQGTLYQYRIEGPKDNWSKWSAETEINPGIIPPGDYVLQVRAKNILGEISEIRTLKFSVPQRLFLRWYFLLLYVGILSLAIFGLIKWRERSLLETQRILEEKVALRTSELEEEKVKTEELLLNILPRDTAKELQMHGKATARHYNQVSVLFTDFKGFTEFAENTKPEDLVNELHRCFVGFDEIIGKYYLEKIKTIGDAYMCAGGVPIRNNSNAIAITLAALEIRDFMMRIADEKRKRNEPTLEIRIGIHTGPLTAGVVGLKKFAYDIWGDTVNTASRMESGSEPGRINVSGTTYELIKKYFECEYRGKKEVKGKGAVEMYFVNAIKPEFSEKGEGIVPNKGLWELIS